MKKITALLLCAALIFSICGCGNPNKPEPPKPDEPVIPKAGPELIIGTLNDEAYGEGCVVYNGSVDCIFTATPGYENLNKSLELYNEDKLAALELNKQEASDFYYASSQDLPQELLPFFSSLGIIPARDDSVVVSFIASDEGYFGGAHGWYEGDGYNYDTQTGARLTLREVISDYDAFWEVLAGMLEKYNEEECGGGFDENWKDTAKSLIYSDDYSDWCLCNDSLEVWFDTYVLGPYAMGCVDLVISADEHPELFAAKYLPAGSDTPAPVHTESSELVTYLFDSVAMPVCDRFGTLSYPDCEAMIKGDGHLKDGYEFEYTEPWSTESCGEIKITDSENDCDMIIFFEPKPLPNGEYPYGGEVFASEIWYRSENYGAVFGNIHMDGKNLFEFIDYNTHKGFYVKDIDALAKLMFGYRSYKE